MTYKGLCIRKKLVFFLNKFHPPRQVGLQSATLTVGSQRRWARFYIWEEGGVLSCNSIC
jgi:hypothetical protein